MIYYNICLENIPDSPFTGDWRIIIDFYNDSEHLAQLVQWGSRNELLSYLINAVGEVKGKEITWNPQANSTENGIIKNDDKKY